MDNPSVMVTYLSPILGLLLEAVLCFAGYRLQRIGIALIGFLLGAGIGMSIAGDREGLAWLAIVLALAGGILFSVLAYRMYLAGIFLLSGILAFTIAQAPLLLLHLPGWANIAGGAVIGIERNFIIVKYFLFFPTRFCLKNTGPGESSFIITATISIGIAAKTIPINESTISRTLLKKLLYTYISPEHSR